MCGHLAARTLQRQHRGTVDIDGWVGRQPSTQSAESASIAPLLAWALPFARLRGSPQGVEVDVDRQVRCAWLVQEIHNCVPAYGTGTCLQGQVSSRPVSI